jgi:phospholipase C
MCFVFKLAAVLTTLLYLIPADIFGQAPIFQHIVVLVQENRTPDNLFQGLCSPPFGTANSCSTHPTGPQYNIQTSNWLNKLSPTKTTQPQSALLAAGYDLDHSHLGFIELCDYDATLPGCRMDGQGSIACWDFCPQNAQHASLVTSEEF